MRGGADAAKEPPTAEALRLHLQNAGRNAVLSHLKQAAQH